MKKFPKKRIVITGAGSGLGRATAVEFARLGWNVCVSDIHMGRAEDSLNLVRKNGGEGFTCHCDVARPEALENLAATIEQQWGGVDIVMNNAGVAAAGYMEKIPLETWDWIININLKSVIYGCRTFIPMLSRQGCGHIVNVASCAGIASLPEMSCYNVTKAGVISLSETLRTELKPKGIGVSVIAPTFFKTNLMDQFTAPDDRQKKMAEAFFNKSRATAEQMALHVVRSVRRNKLYVIPQWDGKFSWFSKRLTPELYFDVMGWGYKKGIVDKLLET